MADQYYPFEDWLAGFLDGEGCLRLNVKMKGSGLGYRVDPTVSISQAQTAGVVDAEGFLGVKLEKDADLTLGYHAKPTMSVSQSGDEPPLIGALNEYFTTVGATSTISVEESDEYLDQYRVQVRGIENVLAVLEPLRDKLICKHRQACILLDEVIPLLQAKSGHGIIADEQWFLQIMEAKERLDSYKGGNRGKYNLEYFEDYFDLEYDPDWHVEQAELSDFTSTVVYTTKNRQSKYHKKKCHLMKNGSVRILQKVAEKRGLEKCEKCHGLSGNNIEALKEPTMAGKLEGMNADEI